MKFLFVILFFISLEQISLQQQQKGENWDNLMSLHIKELKEIFIRERKKCHEKIDESREKEVREEIRAHYKNMSSQAVDDTTEVALKFNDQAVYTALEYMFDQLKSWGAKQFVLNATYVEQKQKEYANKWGQLNYAFLLNDYNECLELFKTDLSQKLDPDTVSRILSLRRMVYGDQKEIETALSYLYGTAVDTPTDTPD